MTTNFQNALIYIYKEIGKHVTQVKDHLKQRFPKWTIRRWNEPEEVGSERKWVRGGEEKAAVGGRGRVLRENEATYNNSSLLNTFKT